jgi:hypothetical protein
MNLRLKGTTQTLIATPTCQGATSRELSIKGRFTDGFGALI